VGTPLAIPRRNSTEVAGRCRVFAKTFHFGGCHSPGRPASGKLEKGLGRETGAAGGAHKVGISVHSGGDTVRANACRCGHPVTRRWKFSNLRQVSFALNVNLYQD
jgi:hypothetical protein